jgi:RNA polymerase sigma-70 factor (ECF subfamily)
VDLDLAVRELAPKLMGYCAARTGDPTLAEDVAQDALAALIRRWRRDGPPDSPTAFVFAIARRRCARAMVRRRLLLPLDGARARPDSRRDPEAALVDQAERRRVTAALRALRRKDRDLLLLLAAGDLTMSDAARLFGVSTSAIKMRASRARQHLRSLLESHDGANRRG